MKKFGGRRAGAVVAAALAALLAVACGGGGGGGGGAANVPAEPVIPSSQAPLQLTRANSHNASTLTFGLTGRASALGQIAADWLAISLSGAGPRWSLPCGASGSATLSLVDRDGNGRPSAGDQLDAQLQSCLLKPLGEIADGTLSIELTTVGTSQWAGTIKFGAPFGPTAGSQPYQVEGALQFQFDQDRLAKTLRVSSASQPLTFVYTEAGQVLKEQLTQLDSTREIRRDTAQVHAVFRSRLASDSLGGALSLSTVSQWRSWYGHFASTGELSVTGNAGLSARVLPATPVDYSVYLNGEPVPYRGPKAAVPRYLWSGAGWLDDNPSEPDYASQEKDALKFRLLQVPAGGQPRATIETLEWAFSRPLVMTTWPRAVLRRLASNGALTGLPDIKAELRPEGALLGVVPSSPLEPGNNYEVRFDSAFLDGQGGRLSIPDTRIYIPVTIRASLLAEAPSAVLGSEGQLVLDARGSTATNGVVQAFQWRQLSGPALTFSATDQARVSVRSTAAANGIAVVELAVRSPEGDWARAEIRFQVLADSSQAAFIHYRNGKQASVVVSHLDAPTVRIGYYPSSDVVDISWSSDRFFANLPAGMSWKAGIRVAYGEGTVRDHNAVWIRKNDTSNCPSLYGEFSVLEYETDPGGQPTKLAIDVDEYCDAQLVRSGSIRYHSKLPIRQ